LNDDAGKSLAFSDAAGMQRIAAGWSRMHAFGVDRHMDAAGADVNAGRISRNRGRTFARGA
jgi:formylmethanofuran dehydrogenase subunit A